MSNAVPFERLRINGMLACTKCWQLIATPHLVTCARAYGNPDLLVVAHDSIKQSASDRMHRRFRA